MFFVVCRARSAKKLKVLEVVCICFYKSDLCKQKKACECAKIVFVSSWYTFVCLGFTGC